MLLYKNASTLRYYKTRLLLFLTYTIYICIIKYSFNNHEKNIFFITLFVAFSNR